ncbi:MAG: PAS-domain containing protein [Holosporales bacterium]|jgi:signal transduction histidine kinase|nr:PAS-domain containing protein [Holosporales bacterium]
MNEEYQVEEIGLLLADASRMLPMAYATWKSHGERVFLSDMLVAMLNAPGNLLLPLEFVKLMQRRFGQFLSVAVDRLSDGCQKRREYSSTVTLSNEDFSLRLVFESETDLYMLIIDTRSALCANAELAQLLDTLPIYIWQEDKDMNITYCNMKYANAVESTQEGVIANNIGLIAKKHKHRHSFKSLPYGPSQLHCEGFNEPVIVNGERRALSITNIAKDERCSTWIAIDVTDREDLQKEHALYKKQTEEIFDNISVPIAIFDRDTALVFANIAIIKLFRMDRINLNSGCKFSDVVNNFISDDTVVMNSSASEYKEKIIRLISTLVEPYYSSINLHDGRIMNVMILPTRDGGLMFMFEDVSERIGLERKIGSLAAMHEELASGLSEGVIIFGDDNRIKLTNKALLRILHTASSSHDQTRETETSKAGVSEDESASAVGLHVRDFFESYVNAFATGAADDFFAIVISAAAARSAGSDLITFTNGKTARYRYYPLPENLNMITFADVTDSLALDNVISEKERIVAQLDSIKEILISKIVCEFKTPLNAISGFAEILYDMHFGSLNDKQLGYCLELKNIAVNLAGTIDTITNLMNIEYGNARLKFEETDIPAFLDKIVKLLMEQAECCGINFISDIEIEKAIATIDRQSVKTAIGRLVSRAIKVSPRGSSIFVRLTQSPTQEKFVDIEVSDNGVSVSADDVEDYAKMMSESNPGSLVGYGSSLEIVLAREILKLHNGKVAITSDGDSGTKVTCSIPVI